MSPGLSTAPSEHAPIGARPLRILVADDERDFVLTLTLLLRDEGYEVRGVYDGTQALEAARGFQPDVVLLDIGMPNLSGYDTARALRLEYGKSMVLIAVTAYDKAADKMLAEMAGFDHHFGKPFDPQTLTKLLSTLDSKA